MSKNLRRSPTLTRQQWTAVSLVLQAVSRHDFSGLDLLSDDNRSFVLRFTGDRKLICYFPNSSKPLTAADGLRIARRFAQQLNSRDELLIAASNLSQKLASQLPGASRLMIGKNLPIKAALKKLPGGAARQLQRIHLWHPARTGHREAALALFCSLNSLRSIGSAEEKLRCSIALALTAREEAHFTKEELISLGCRTSPELEDDRSLSDEQLLAALDRKAVKRAAAGKGSFLETLAGLSNRRFALDRLRGSLTAAQLGPAYPLLLPAFLRNVDTADNRAFILEFLQEQAVKVQEHFLLNSFAEDRLSLLSALQAAQPALSAQILPLLGLPGGGEPSNAAAFFEPREAPGSRRRTELLAQIVCTAHEDVRDAAAELLMSLLCSGSAHAVYLPELAALRQWLTADFRRFPEYFRRLVNGLERLCGDLCDIHADHSGASEEALEDLPLIEHVMAPALQSYYQSDPVSAWEFITSHCITPDNRLGPRRPDCLNRAAIPIIVKHYREGDSSARQAAFRLLVRLAKSKKGRPRKAALIFNELQAGSSIEHASALLDGLLGRIVIAPDPFLEKAACAAARQGAPAACSLLEAWLKKLGAKTKNRDLAHPLKALEALLDGAKDKGVELVRACTDKRTLAQFSYREAWIFARLFCSVFAGSEDVRSVFSALSSGKRLNSGQRILAVRTGTQITATNEMGETEEQGYVYEVIRCYGRLCRDYDREIFFYIYRFIAAFITKHYQPCADLLRNCLSAEETYVKANQYNGAPPWFVYHGIGSILETIFERDQEFFLAAMQQFAGYPAYAYLGDLQGAINLLVSLPGENPDKQSILSKLQLRRPSFYVLPPSEARAARPAV